MVVQRGQPSEELDRGSIGTSPMYGIGSPPKKYKYLPNTIRRSSIPYMQRLLNEHKRDKKEILKQISDYKPVNNGFYCKSVSLRN